VVVGELNKLFAHLSEVRAATETPPPPRASINPVRGDPYADFAGFASQVISFDTRLSLRPGISAADLDRAAATELDNMFQKWRAPIADARTILAKDLLLSLPIPQRRGAMMTLSWMAKLGMIDWLDG
jgi:D-inositol-3-phosphate glycosyltransferase